MRHVRVRRCSVGELGPTCALLSRLTEGSGRERERHGVFADVCVPGTAALGGCREPLGLVGGTGGMGGHSALLVLLHLRRLSMTQPGLHLGGLRWEGEKVLVSNACYAGCCVTWAIFFTLVETQVPPL